ncbi:uncharacterized protein V6R79_003744 [Siganus canaliculatus]
MKVMRMRMSHRRKRRRRRMLTEICKIAACTDKLWDLEKQAYFSSPYSLSSDRSSEPPPTPLHVQALGNRNEARRKERMDGKEREQNAMGEKKDGAQRKGGEEESGGGGGGDRQTEQQHMERLETERTDE